MLSLILDVPELENLSQPRKIVFHAYVKKSKKEDGIGFNVHEILRKIEWFLFYSFLNKNIFFFKKNDLKVLK